MGYLDKALETMQKQGGRIVNHDLLDATLREIGKGYQPGLIGWIKGNPDRWTVLLTLEGRVNEKALGGNIEGLREALNEYQSLILTMVKEFTLKEQRSFNFVERPQSPGAG